MKNDSLNCYGNFGHDNRRCAECAYSQSCEYYAKTASVVESRAKLTSFEQVDSWNAEAADYDHIPGENRQPRTRLTIISMLSGFFRFLLELDDYSLGIISEIISPAGGESISCTVSRLGEIHGCSRQAMHRKILDMIARNPELAGLLKNTMYKLSRSRHTFLRNRAAAALKKR